MTSAVTFERRGYRVVDAYYARRIADKMPAHGCLQAVPEKGKQQRNGDMQCSSRCGQRACHRRTRSGWAAK